MTNCKNPKICAIKLNLSKMKDFLFVLSLIEFFCQTEIFLIYLENLKAEVNMKKFLVICAVFVLMLAIVPNVPFKPQNPVPAKQMFAFAEERSIENELASEGGEEVENQIELTETSLSENSNLIEYYADQTKLCVVGEATKTLTPDRAQVYAQAKGFGKDCTEAKDEAFKMFDKAVEALVAHGCDKSKITIESFYSRPCRECHCQGCHGNLSFSFFVEDLSKTDEIISAILENGVDEVSSICYEVSNIEEEYTLLLSDALENAKTKASKLLGDDLQLIDIREESVYYSNCLYREYVENGSSYVGGIEVKTRVEATFI